MSEHISPLEIAAKAIDASQSWQFIGGSRSLTEDDYNLSVVSRGPISKLGTIAFEGISELVCVESVPDDTSFSTVHFVSYQGDGIGLEIFVEKLLSVDGRSEGNRDMIKEFVQDNPFWLLEIMLRSD